MNIIILLRRYIRDVVYGANDGLITTFAIVASVEGAGMGTGAILIVGFASLFADGFSMASSDYLASKAETARKLQDAGSRVTDIENPLLAAFFTFMAFILIGVIPLVPYFFYDSIAATAFRISGLFTGIALFSIGALRTKVTGGNALRAGGEMLLLGGSAAVVAYMIGTLVEQWQ